MVVISQEAIAVNYIVIQAFTNNTTGDLIEHIAGSNTFMIISDLGYII